MEVNRRKWWIISLAGTVGFFFAIAPVLDPYIVIEIGSGFTLKINDIIMLFLTMLCFSKSYRFERKTGFLCMWLLGLGIIGIFGNLVSNTDMANSFKNLIVWLIYAFCLTYLWKTPCRDKFFQWMEIIAIVASMLVILQFVMSRSRKKVMEKFGDKVIPVIQDVAQPLGILSKYDYIIHCASNADPKSYAIQPVETILTNILGNKNVLEYCKEYKKCRMLLTSTFEVYGEISNTSVYSYVVDVVSGIFKVLFNGLNGEVYNIANENSIASIAEVASICAEIAGTNVVFDLPDKIEKKGFSQSKDCILDNSKLKSLGWNGKYTLKQGLVETIESLREDE